jgi:hypothetical protein
LYRSLKTVLVRVTDTGEGGLGLTSRNSLSEAGAFIHTGACGNIGHTLRCNERRRDEREKNGFGKLQIRTIPPENQGQRGATISGGENRILFD